MADWNEKLVVKSVDKVHVFVTLGNGRRGFVQFDQIEEPIMNLNRVSTGIYDHSIMIGNKIDECSNSVTFGKSRMSFVYWD